MPELTIPPFRQAFLHKCIYTLDGVGTGTPLIEGQIVTSLLTRHRVFNADVV